MNLKQLEAFVKVAEGGSFSKAAKDLYLTQPTVSAHISSLEKELNVRLFIRNTKEVGLSEDGKRLYQMAHQMVELERQIEDTFCADNQKDSKCVTIATSTIPAQYLLPEILAKFREKYPGEQFRIVETDSAGVIEKVTGHLVDVGFTGTVLEKKHCKYLPFYRDELVVIMPNTEHYQNILKTENTLKWLEREPMIMREEGSGTRKEAEKLLRREGLDTDMLNIVASIENTETIKKSVRSGIGVTVISRLAAKDELDSGLFLEFPMSDSKGGRDLNLVYNKNFKLSASTERFIKTVKNIYHLTQKA